MADKIATRQAYGEALIELVEKNDKVVVLDADLANATQTCKVAKAHPEKFYNFGIAEANMVDAAAGMSTMGLVPFCSTFAMFAAHLTADLGKLLRVHGRPPCKISFAQFDSIPKYGRKVNSFLRHIVADFRLFAYIGRGEGRGHARFTAI